jgi:AbrB family transcriptional regulator (stage V sporulation protein T)
MKATGIIRRIDDLGRVVIPKEIRDNLRIRENDPMEIYVSDNGEVIFRKYQPEKFNMEIFWEYFQKIGTNDQREILNEMLDRMI